MAGLNDSRSSKKSMQVQRTGVVASRVAFIVFVIASITSGLGGSFVVAWSSVPWKRFLGMIIALCSSTATVLVVVHLRLSAMPCPEVDDEGKRMEPQQPS